MWIVQTPRILPKGQGKSGPVGLFRRAPLAPWPVLFGQPLLSYKWGSSSFNAAYRSINQCRRSELHLYGSRARSLSQEGKNRTMFNDSAEKIRAQEGTLSHTFHVTMNSFLIRKQSSTYVPFSSTQGISTKQSICVPPIVARPVWIRVESLCCDCPSARVSWTEGEGRSHYRKKKVSEENRNANPVL